MQCWGGKVLRAIQGAEPLMVQNAKRLSPALLCKMCKDLEKARGEIGWGKRGEERADLMGARDRLDATEGLRGIVSLTVVELALVLQKRRRWHAKDTPGTSGSVLDRVTGLGAGLAHVG
jgi:hypothetical protein